jgi:hypothetical protein
LASVITTESTYGGIYLDTALITYDTETTTGGVYISDVPSTNQGWWLFQSDGDYVATPAYNAMAVLANPINSAEAFGTPGIRSTISGAGAITSAEAFGVPNVGRLIFTGTGNIASAETFGAVKVSRSYDPDAAIRERRTIALMLSGERGELYYQPRIFLSNVLGEELAEVPGVISAAVDLSNYRDNTWQITMDCEKTDAFDPYSDWVLAALDVKSDRDDWQRFYLGLYKFDLPAGTDNPDESFWSLSGMSPEFLLMKKPAITGFTVPKGGSVFQAVKDCLTAVGIPSSRLTLPPNAHDANLPKGVRYDPIADKDQSLYIRIANNTLGIGGFGALQTTATGQFFFNPIVTLDEKQPTAFYGPPDEGGEDFILYQPIDRKPDYSRFANEVFVYSSNTQTAMDTAAPDYKAIARNDSLDSPVSIPNLGYTVTKYLQQDDLVSQDAAEKLAIAELVRATSYHLERTIRTIPDPRRTADEAYWIEVNNAMGMPIMEGKWQAMSWKMPLSSSPSDMIMEHTVSRNERFGA